MRKTQIILIVIFLLFVVSLFMFILYNIWEVEGKIASLEKANQKAFWAAEAGLEYGKIYSRDNPLLTGVFGPFTLSSDTRFFFSIQNLGGNRRRISAVGRYYNTGGNLISERRIRVDIEGIGDAITGNEQVISGSFYQY